ncbi:MAG: hypothetical protein M3N29_01140 [Chloroflexota bacterium]|nr:hypothetical protein [Chloroflexota bacterium]
MPDVEKILRLVAEGVLTPDEADEILAVLAAPEHGTAAGAAHASREAVAGDERARQLRIEISERGRRVVNVRVPINVASVVAGIVPGLSDEEGERIRSSIRSGVRGPIVDIGDEDGDRVLIVSE